MIAVLTSGGDAPGMNAAIRAVVRTTIDSGKRAFGVQRGFAGLMEGAFVEMGPREVGGIVQRGGTVLGSARSVEFKTPEGRQKALGHLQKAGITGLVVIGGNGSQTGANALYEMGFPVVGVASTIDNDLLGTDVTIGVDTAINIALEAIDRLKVTAGSHRRAFLVEVMGRDCGYLALMAAIAGGAEAVAIPEMEMSPEKIEATLQEAYARGKTGGIVVVAEGAKYNAEALAAWFAKERAYLGYELRTVTLGHVQRGGAPTAADRVLASRLGAEAVAQLLAGNKGVLVGLKGGIVMTTALAEIAGKTKAPDLSLLTLADALST
jgi:6-phosphofructokinase 1